MTQHSETPESAPPGLLARVHDVHQAAAGAFTRWLGGDVLQILARLTLAGVFWRSLLTKVEVTKLFTYTELINDFPVERAHVRLPSFPLEMKPATLYQFEQYDLPLLPSGLAAWMATLGEFLLPLMLVFGVLTRLSAFGLLIMTLVIELFVIDGGWWGTHALWIVMAGYIIAHGPGRLSVDHWAGRFSPASCA